MPAQVADGAAKFVVGVDYELEGPLTLEIELGLLTCCALPPSERVEDVRGQLFGLVELDERDADSGADLGPVVLLFEMPFLSTCPLAGCVRSERKKFERPSEGGPVPELRVQLSILGMGTRN
jgi:hypothetical protein